MFDDETKALLREQRRLARESERYFTGKDYLQPISALDLSRAEYPPLTTKQLEALAGRLEAEVAESQRQRGWLLNRLDRLVKECPEMIARVPSVEELLTALGGDAMEPAARIEKFRQLSKLSEQERLDMLPPAAKKKSGIEQKDANPVEAAPPTPNPYADDTKANEEIAQRLRYANVTALRAAEWPSRLRDYRKEIRKIAASSPAASVADILRAKGVKSLEEIPDPQLRVALHRQHKSEKTNGARQQEGSPQIIDGMDVTSDAFRALSPQARIAAARKAGRK